MSQQKISLEKFLEAVDATNKPFVQKIDDYMLNNGCKGTFEEKKTGLFCSYKHTKTKKSVANLFLKEQDLSVRIYGENIDSYSDFLNTLPTEMVTSIEEAGVCKRLVHNTCSPKCSGYDFTIDEKHFQKCRYGCFEFLVTDESLPFIESFLQHEVEKRAI